MSSSFNTSKVSSRLLEISEELQALSKVAKPESANYSNLDDTFAQINSLYETDIDVELIAMQSGLHPNTVRKLFKDKDAFSSAKLSTIQAFLDTLGISIWTR